MLRKGSRNRPSAITPRPPMKQSSERQSRRPGGALSSPLTTVAPVAVMPDTDSKKASTGLIPIDAIMKGTAPAMASVIHNRLTSRKPNRLLAVGGRPWVASVTASARPPSIRAEKAKACQSGLPK